MRKILTALAILAGGAFLLSLTSGEGLNTAVKSAAIVGFGCPLLVVVAVVLFFRR